MVYSSLCQPQDPAEWFWFQRLQRKRCLKSYTAKHAVHQWTRCSGSERFCKMGKLCPYCTSIQETYVFKRSQPPRPSHRDTGQSVSSTRVRPRTKTVNYIALVCWLSHRKALAIAQQNLKGKSTTAELLSLSYSWVFSYSSVPRHTLASKKFLAPLTPSMDTSISESFARVNRPLSSSSSPAAALWKISRN